ncbi:MAG: hypothetical protein C5B58_07090 [Acidobacteria bacterium]|nr:MAG: hypothetical protein C5B58_07090 [Acidobacteriota bacterium]
MAEIDPAKVQRLCERARHAIVDRIIDLCPEAQDVTVNAEREELEEASRKLALHEHAQKPRMNGSSVRRRS